MPIQTRLPAWVSGEIAAVRKKITGKIKTNNFYRLARKSKTTLRGKFHFLVVGGGVPEREDRGDGGGDQNR